jgi:hypothetical protein
MNSGYAIYSKTLGRFITGVHKTAAKAEAEAGDAPEGHEHETRKV